MFSQIFTKMLKNYVSMRFILRKNGHIPLIPRDDLKNNFFGLLSSQIASVNKLLVSNRSKILCHAETCYIAQALVTGKTMDN